MWYARIDDKNQIFVIEDREGNVIATRIMPTTISPNPGREVLMSKDNNREAWANIYDLVKSANRELS